MMKYTAQDIADWFIGRAHSDYVDSEKGGDLMTHLKLQKLLYFAQGCYLAMKDEPLFDDKIYAWTYGPVVESIYQKYKEFDGRGIDRFDAVSIDSETESILEEVYDVFGEYSAWALSGMTHDHAPWKNHIDANGEIPQSEIKDYFNENIVTD